MQLPKRKPGKLVSVSPRRKSIIVLAMYLAAMALLAVVFSQFVDQDSIQEVVERTKPLGVIIFTLLEIVYVTFTPLLNTFVLIAAGYLFGGTIGFIVNFIATTLGLFLIVWLVKRYGRPLLRKLVSERWYSKFDSIVKKVGPLTLLVVYVLPFTPDDELTYIVAAGPLGFKRFVIPVVLGTIAKAAYSYIGDEGVNGVAIAAYFRVVLLVIGLIAVGLQELRINKHRTP